jgi:glycerophosphoryl diester phosphodiesterase
MTSDRQVVVSHDPTGERMAKVGSQIRESTLSDIKRWDLTRGIWAHRNGQAVRMPTLDEVLDAFPNALLNVDVKQEVPEMLGPLLEVIESRAAEARVLLTSFRASITRRIRALGYQGATGMAKREVASVLFLPRSALWLTRVRAERMQIPLRAGLLGLDRAGVVRKAHQLGLRVDFWVVNDQSMVERLLELGADGIVTDDPRAIAAVYARSPRTSAWRQRHR